MPKMIFDRVKITRTYTKPSTLNEDGSVKWPSRSYAVLLEPYGLGLSVSSEVVDFTKMAQDETGLEITALVQSAGRDRETLAVSSCKLLPM